MHEIFAYGHMRAPCELPSQAMVGVQRNLERQGRRGGGAGALEPEQRKRRVQAVSKVCIFHLYHVLDLMHLHASPRGDLPTFSCA